MQSIRINGQDRLPLDTPMILHWYGRLPLLSYQLFAAHPNVGNVVSTRLGGVSQGAYTSLNLALSSFDAAEHVLENRRLLCEAVGVALETLTVGQLVQGVRITVVNEPLRGRGALDRTTVLPATDGLVTNLLDTPLLMPVADCAAVSFFDPVQQVVAIAHAGWRGVAGKIAVRMIAVMQDTFGCNPHDILVGISPNLGKHDLQVRDDVVATYQQSFGDQTRLFFTLQMDGSFLLDMNAALLLQLKECGIRQDHVEVAGITTARTDLFYSHRMEKGKTGRFAGLIVLRSKQ